ncbi:MAG: queuosine precursor transporter [Deltaproteobacteria bacterium]|jgi:uncharacterized integral membrane protein (TIGR00697 family)|nr:queuosine precursor transporter [Deltaproteobacteria bacterium]
MNDPLKEEPKSGEGSRPSPDVNPESLEIIAVLFAGLLIISNLASSRLVDLGPFSFDAGTLIFPLTYILGDVLTEVYGYARSRRVIWVSFFSLLLCFLTLNLVSLIPGPGGADADEAWSRAMTATPRIALGSLLAFASGEFLNAGILSRMKTRNPNKGPAGRFVASTLAGEGLDTLVFATVAFWGTLPWPLFLSLIISNYVFKCLMEIILLPLTLLSARALKKARGADAADGEISLSPFSWRI